MERLLVDDRRDPEPGLLNEEPLELVGNRDHGRDREVLETE